jgi:hypothetical protein
VTGPRVRSALFPARLALARLRAASGRSALVALGIAVGAAMLALSVGGSTAVRDRAVAVELTRLGPSDSSVQVVWSGVPAQASAPVSRLDSVARETLHSLARGRPFGVSLFRQANFGGAFISLGGVDGLARWVSVRSGRLPHACTPQSCELLRIGSSSATPRLPFLHVVGAGALRKDAPLRAYFGGRGPPLLLAEGALAVGRLPIPDAELIARTYGWVLPVTPGSLHDWEIPALAQRVDVAESKLGAVDPVFSVSAPLDALGGAHARARVAGQRLLLVGGDAAVLLLAFAVLAAARLRRDEDDARRRLTWSGAHAGQLALFTSTEAVAIAGLAVVAGWLAGAGAAALLARFLSAQAGPVLAHSVVSLDGILFALALALVAAAVVVASLRAELASFGTRAVTTADVAALGAAGAVLLAVARGDTSAESVGGGTGVFLLLLPALVVFAAAVVAARLLAPAFRALGRARGPLPLRLASLSLARRGGAAVVAAAFVVVSAGVALFAVTYRATLERGQRDQAAFSVPADYVLSEDLTRLVPIQRVSPARLGTLGDAVEVVRLSGDQRGRGFTLVGVPATALADVQGWRDRPDAAVLRALGPSRTLDGIDVRASRLTFPISVRGAQVSLTLDIRRPRGDFATVPLGNFETGSHVLHPRVPAGRIVALRLAFPAIAAFLSGHRESGTSLSVSNASRGVLRLPREFSSWIGSGGVTVQDGEVHYLVNRAAVSLLRPRQPTDGVPVPALVSRGLAARGPILSLTVNGAPLTVRVVGTTRWFPSVRGEAVVADRDTVSTALNSTRPGVAVPGEVWVLHAKPHAAAELSHPPFDRLSVASHAHELHALRTDPLARGTLAVLTVTAVVALALALVGLVLSVVTDVRDESGELFELRAQGLSAGELRRYLRVRASLVAAGGTAGGVATGALLVALVTSVVAVTAGATTPVPPLVVALDWPLLALGAVLFCVAAASLVFLATVRAAR